jgi:hypothetical protein
MAAADSLPDEVWCLILQHVGQRGAAGAFASCARLRRLAARCAAKVVTLFGAPPRATDLVYEAAARLRLQSTKTSSSCWDGRALKDLCPCAHALEVMLGPTDVLTHAGALLDGITEFELEGTSAQVNALLLLLHAVPAAASLRQLSLVVTGGSSSSNMLPLHLTGLRLDALHIQAGPQLLLPAALPAAKVVIKSTTCPRFQQCGMDSVHAGSMQDLAVHTTAPAAREQPIDPSVLTAVRTTPTLKRLDLEQAGTLTGQQLLEVSPGLCSLKCQVAAAAGLTPQLLRQLQCSAAAGCSFTLSTRLQVDGQGLAADDLEFLADCEVADLLPGIQGGKLQYRVRPDGSYTLFL